MPEEGVLEVLGPFVAFSRAMIECYDRNAQPCRAQVDGRDCFWQQGFKPYSEYQPLRMCHRCAAVWYARCLGIEIEDHLRRLGHRHLDVTAAVTEAADAQSRLLNLEQLVHDVGEVADQLRTALGPHCSRAPSSNCRRVQAGLVGRSVILASEANPVTMCKPCVLVWLVDMANAAAQRMKAAEPTPADIDDEAERTP